MQPPSYSDLSSLVTSYVSKGEKNGLVCALRKPVGPEGSEVADADSGECSSDPLLYSICSNIVYRNDSLLYIVSQFGIFRQKCE